MTTLPEVYFAEIHQLSFDQIIKLMDSFRAAFPFSYDLYAIQSVENLLQETESVFGNPHPPTTAIYDSDFRWSIYHPMLSYQMTENGVLTEFVKIGFKDPKDAMQFKLSMDL